MAARLIGWTSLTMSLDGTKFLSRFAFHSTSPTFNDVEPSAVPVVFARMYRYPAYKVTLFSLETYSK